MRDFLEIGFGFAARGFAERDDADFLVMGGVNDMDWGLVEEAERDVPLLAVPESPVFESVRFTLEDSLDVGEIEAMFREIRLALGSGPGEADIHCIYTPYIRQMSEDAGLRFVP